MAEYLNSRAIILRHNMAEHVMPTKYEEAIRNFMLGKIADFRELLKTAAPEISEETRNEICLAATQRYSGILKTSVGAVKACRAGLKDMYEAYYRTGRGQLDECENRIISTVQAFLRTMNVPKEN